MTLPSGESGVKYILIGVPEIASNHTGSPRHRKNHPQRIGCKDYEANTLNSRRNCDLYLNQ